MPAVWRRFDLSGYDLVLSSSHAFAKAVRRPPGARHVCYCHTPPRYLWDLNRDYRRGLSSALRGPVLSWLRREDLRAAAGVDAFVANSRFVADRIGRTYGREATVVHPPVDVLVPERPAAAPLHWLAGGRLVAYKRIDRAVDAANRRNLPLVVFGDGPERRRLERRAGPTVRFVGRVGNRLLSDLFRTAHAYLFPGVEDFGILPVEAQAHGTPVVALGEGGVRETVVDGVTGVLYGEDSPEALLEAIDRFEGGRWDPEACRAQARRFGRDVFERDLSRTLVRLLA